MPPQKVSISDSLGTTAAGSGDVNRGSHKKETKNSLKVPIEEHWHFPQVEKKQSSLRRSSFKAMVNTLKKFRKSKALQGIHSGPHNPRDDQLVQNFRKMLLEEGLLPEKLDDYHTLLRFLRMSRLEMLKAKDMYLKMLKWRTDLSIDTIEKDFVFEEYEEVKKCYPHGFHGVDRMGRPLYIERIGLVDLNTLLKVTTVDRFVTYHIMEQEKTLNLRFPSCSVAAKRHVASTTAILDVKGVGRNNFSKPAKDLFMEIQKIDSNYYPETLHRLFIINAGSGFKVLWQALKAFMEPRTADKIHVLDSKYQSKLIEAIDPSNLPTFLGGTCTCSEDGGCLKKDKGPWNDPDIRQLLEAIVDKEQNFSGEVNSTAAFDEVLPNSVKVEAPLSAVIGIDLVRSKCDGSFSLSSPSNDPGYQMKKRCKGHDNDFMEFLGCLVGAFHLLGVYYMIQIPKGGAHHVTLDDFDGDRKIMNESTSSILPENVDDYFSALENGQEDAEEQGQMNFLNDVLSKKILALEAGFRDTKLILQKLLLKQDEIVKQIEQVKELAFSASASCSTPID